MYGDPTISWSIGLDVSIAEPVDAADLEERCGSLVTGRPNLGTRPVLGRFTELEAPATLRGLLDSPYGDQDPLVRVTLAEDGRRLLLAAHHGAVDGLGLLAALGILIGEPVVSTASGIGDAPAQAGFLRSSAARLGEALFAPPDRLARGRVGHRAVERKDAGDVTARKDLPPSRVNTAGIAAAAVAAFAQWNVEQGGRSRRTVLAIGASRRDGKDARPDRDTAYLRVRLTGDLATEHVREAIAATSPEPSFPERPVGRWAGLLTRALRSRLGSSLLVSNLGLVEGSPRVERIAFFPSAAGPQALAVGVASTSSHTTLTVRLPAADFAPAAAEQLCSAIALDLDTVR